MRDFIAYAQFESVWECFQPETPFGRTAKDAMTIHREASELERIWDDTESALQLLEELGSEPARLSQITHHLKRIPRIQETPRPQFDEVEIFQFKKFLYNYKCLASLLNTEIQNSFGFGYESNDFEKLLDTGRQSAESFFVADAFSEELAKVRADIETTNVAIQALQQQRVEAIQARWGLHFGDRTFLIVPRELLSDLGVAATLLVVEPFDERRYSVRPLACGEELNLQEHRSALLSKERLCENHVLVTLSSAADCELENLKSYQDAVTRFDLAFARARLAQAHSFVRPRLQGGPIEISQGRFLPCEALCQELGTPYLPLDACFDTPATVIFGSNMGGKTVVLKSLAFLQLCAQTGLFVPAAAFATRVFQHFSYLGEGRENADTKGLSGFGCEIRGLVETWKTLGESTLVIFDEFARTTNSMEAEAILSAVVESLQGKPHVIALFSTHFRGVQRFPEARYLRMKGLDRQGLALEQDAGMALASRIRVIDEHMDFRLVPDVANAQVADAIAVAKLLGLAPEIAARAEHFFNQGH
ncbi:MAG: hypothetical protein Q8O00_15995 [Holophaga sp.]|nr:hypothetical protein [Holophaga sp.]